MDLSEMSLALGVSTDAVKLLAGAAVLSEGST